MQVRNLILWMDDLMRQMKTSEKPRDVSGVELLMNNHQGHKAEIEARQDNFEDCKSLGKELLSRSHYASNEIKEKLNELINMSNEMHHRWEERWEHLQLILEVYQFARDAAVAEAWLMAQDPYLKSEELGVSFLNPNLPRHYNLKLLSFLANHRRSRKSYQETRGLRKGRCSSRGTIFSLRATHNSK